MSVNKYKDYKWYVKEVHPNNDQGITLLYDASWYTLQGIVSGR